MKTVLASGCLDILHIGHIAYLETARLMGDRLVVGINSDASVRALKGESRPINNQQDRATMLYALRCVDEVIIFEELTVVELLKWVKPAIWCKGGSYDINTLNKDERRAAEELKIEIAFIPMVEGKSTTRLIERLKNESNQKS